MFQRIFQVLDPSQRSYKRDLEEWERDVQTTSQAIVPGEDSPAPAAVEESLKEEREDTPAPESSENARAHSPAPGSEYEEKVISGYWAAPSIRGLKDLGPGKSQSLRLGIMGAQDGSDASDGSPEIDPDRLSALAGDIQRCNRELNDLLHQLTGDVAESDSPRSIETSTGESKPGSEQARKKTPLRAIKNRVFRPQGVLTVAPVKAMRAQITKGRLFFPCPACNRLTELYATMAGKDTRCPNCFSAIRAPHPKKGIKGRNREQDKETLLRPELFSVTVPEARPGALLPLRALQRMPLIKALAILVLVAGVIKVSLLSLSGSYADKKAIEKQAATGTKESVLYAGSGELRGRAEDAVRGFLHAESWAEKAQFVRNHDKIITRMESYYLDHPKEASADYISLTSNAPAHSVPGDIDYPLTEVVVQFGNYELSVFRVEHLPEGDLIEWEASVGYNPVEWGEIVEMGTIREMETTFRVLAAPDNYYNYRYESSKYLCVRLQDPSDNELMAYGYIRRDSAEAKELDFMLSSASPEKPRRLMVEVKFDRNSMKTKQVQLTRMVQDGWRVESGILLSSAE